MRLEFAVRKGAGAAAAGLLDCCAGFSRPTTCPLRPAAPARTRPGPRAPAAGMAAAEPPAAPPAAAHPDFAAWRRGAAVVVLAQGRWPSGSRRPRNSPDTVPVLSVVMPHPSSTGGLHAWVALTPDAVEAVADRKGLAAADCDVLLRHSLAAGRFSVEVSQDDDSVIIHADYGLTIGDVAWRLGVDERDRVGDRLLSVVAGLAAAPVAPDSLPLAASIPGSTARGSQGGASVRSGSLSTNASPSGVGRPAKRPREASSLGLSVAEAGASSGDTPVDAVVAAGDDAPPPGPGRPAPPRPRRLRSALALNPGVGMGRRKRKPGALG